MSEKYNWWEKTVEYTFVIQAHNQKFLKLAPLDGDHEQAADTILQDENSKFCLIEFKKGAASQGDEYIKYLNCTRANLRQEDIEWCRSYFQRQSDGDSDFANTNLGKLRNLKKEAFHLIIFAKRKGTLLELQIQQYLDYLAYDKTEPNTPKEIDWQNFLNYFANRDEFLDYVHELVELKKGKNMQVAENGSSSSAFANVLAINNNGETCTLLEIIQSKEYQNKFPNNELTENIEHNEIHENLTNTNEQTTHKTQSLNFK